MTAATPEPAAQPLSAKATRVRSALLIIALVFFALAAIAFVIAIIADVTDPAYNNPFRSVFLVVPFGIVFALNALVWRALVGPLSRTESSSRVVFVVLVTLALAVASVILVVILLMLSTLLPFV